MNPTKAPWADAPPAAAAAGPAGPNRHTGKPVRPLIDTEAQLPTVDPASWPATWQPAHKRIRSQQDVDAAIKGATLRSFIAFCISLNQSVVGKKLSDPCPVSPAAAATLAALDRLLGFIDEVPPATHEVRYGNPAYRAWFQKLQDAAPELVLNILGDERGPATIELLPYFLDSFGNRTRIDYGTGHETNFVAFLFCLYALGALGAEDQQATVTRVFKKYLDLMRKLQTTYWCAHAHLPVRFWLVRARLCSTARPVARNTRRGVQARAGGVARGVGPRRVPLLPVYLGRRAAAGPRPRAADERHKRRHARGVRAGVPLPRRGALCAEREEGAATRDLAHAL